MGTLSPAMVVFDLVIMNGDHNNHIRIEFNTPIGARMTISHRSLK